MSISPLSGPSLVPAQPSHALLCLHGFGSDGHDLLTLAPPLKQALGKLGETLAIFCPNGPAPTRMEQGLQWFSDASWTFRDRSGIDASSHSLWDLTRSITEQYNIPLSNMALLGFSQGAMLALYAAPRWPQPVGAVISCSGTAMWQEELDATTCQKPPVLLLHGIDDDVLPADATVAAAAGLESLGFSVESHLIPNLGHGINPTELAHIAVFLQNLWQPAE